ncbi:hypothetical protein A5764_02695 [Mycobacterium sp. 852002-51057_SCH5723018]|nr:hypothetical protein A5764_02695 [Mycobacterium sp. 852002-51057_SCH5723018]
MAATATTEILPAAADEVSTEIASLFSAHAAGYQQLSAQAAVFHEQFVHALSAGASTYASAEASALQTLAGTVPGLGVDLSGGLSGLEASLSADISGLAGSLNAASSGGFGGGLSGLAQAGGSLASNLSAGLPSLGTALPAGLTGAAGALQGVVGISPSLGANVSVGLSGLSAQLNTALSGGIAAGVSGLPGGLANAVAPFQTLLTAGSPAAFMTQLQAMETGFNSALIHGQLEFNTSLVAQETALETAAFGGPGALNGALDDTFNFWNSVLGTGEIGFDTLLGAQFPVVGFVPGSAVWYSFVSGLYVPGSFAIGNNGWINGLVGALDQKLLFDLHAVGLVGGGLTGGGSLQAALNAPIGVVDGWAAPQVYFIDDLVAKEIAFNANLLSGELGLEQTLFGSTNALNGAVNSAFNIPNVMLATGEEGVNTLLGAFPAPLVGTALIGGATGSFGTVGGLEGVFDQTLSVGFDLAGLM